MLCQTTWYEVSKLVQIWTFQTLTAKNDYGNLSIKSLTAWVTNNVCGNLNIKSLTVWTTKIIVAT